MFHESLSIRQYVPTAFFISDKPLKTCPRISTLEVFETSLIPIFAIALIVMWDVYPVVDAFLRTNLLERHLSLKLFDKGMKFCEILCGHYPCFWLLRKISTALPVRQGGLWDVYPYSCSPPLRRQLQELMQVLLLFVIFS